MNSLSILQIVCQIFPKLQEMKIHHIHTKETESLKLLKQLGSLSSLTVGSVSLEYLKSSLHCIGMNLVTFVHVCYDSNIVAIDLSIIQQNCRNLQRLCLSGNSIINKSEFIGKNKNLFPFLTDVSISTHSPIPYSVWSMVLACTSLSKIELSQCQGLTDQSLALLLSSLTPCLHLATDIHIQGEHRGDVALTESSVVMLADRCPLLKHMGDCQTWSVDFEDPIIIHEIEKFKEV